MRFFIEFIKVWEERGIEPATPGLVVSNVVHCTMQPFCVFLFYPSDNILQSDEADLAKILGNDTVMYSCICLSLYKYRC